PSSSHACHLVLHSFPTRRSSDLCWDAQGRSSHHDVSRYGACRAPARVGHQGGAWWRKAASSWEATPRPPSSTWRDHRTHQVAARGSISDGSVRSRVRTLLTFRSTAYVSSSPATVV